MSSGTDTDFDRVVDEFRSIARKHGFVARLVAREVPHGTRLQALLLRANTSKIGEDGVISEVFRNSYTKIVEDELAERRKYRKQFEQNVPEEKADSDANRDRVRKTVRLTPAEYEKVKRLASEFNPDDPMDFNTLIRKLIQDAPEI